ncbi:DUF4919 domain-containing protein [candidate division WOR-3 bacterium]|nr:DUF4919 domain-containing protein [candidate division WOR-3 bacterium]
MKRLILLILGLFIACSSAERSIHSTENIEFVAVGGQKVKADTTSNYILFDYINLLTENDYYSLLDSIKNGQSSDFFTLRMAYTKTKIYNPYDIKFDDLRKRIKLNMEEQNFEVALETANKILEERYIDIKTHLWCSNIYKQLRDSAKSDYHENIYNGLINSIYFSGDGKSVKTAFIVMEISEEYDLLNWLQLKPPFELSPRIKDGYSFDIIRVFDENRETELFFNIDLALKRFSEEFDL